jgi:hypothetical protein
VVSQQQGISVAAFIESLWREEIFLKSEVEERRNHFRNTKASLKQTKMIIPSVPKMVADLVGQYSDVINSNLAIDTVVCLSQVKAHYHHIGLLHLLDAYLEIGDLKGAQDCHERLKKDNLPIDQACVERFIAVAAQQCSISHMKAILQTHPISRNILVVVAEPLIMSGYTKTFSQLLEKYLSLEPTPKPAEVSIIVKQVLRARVRRSLTDCPLSSLEEEGAEQIEVLFSEYVDKFEDGSESITMAEEIALRGIENYIGFCSDWDGENAPEGLPYSQYDQSQLVTDLPTFNYLEEQRMIPAHHDISSAPNPSHRFLFEDITAQIAQQRPFVYPLYRGMLFDNEAKRELLYAEAVANDVLFSLDGTEIFAQDDASDDESDEFGSRENDEFDEDDDDDMDDDDDDDNEVTYELEMDDVEEEEFFDNMRSAGTATTLAHHDFNDMSQSIKSSYPTIMIEYAEDIFDGISEDNFVSDSLMHKAKKDSRDALMRNGNSGHGNSGGHNKKLVEGNITEDIEKKGPDDEGGVTAGFNAPTIFKEES